MQAFKWALAGVIAVGAAQPQAATVKVGIVGPFSGPYAHYGKLFSATRVAVRRTSSGMQYEDGKAHPCLVTVVRHRRMTP